MVGFVGRHYSEDRMVKLVSYLKSTLRNQMDSVIVNVFYCLKGDISPKQYGSMPVLEVYGAFLDTLLTTRDLSTHVTNALLHVADIYKYFSDNQGKP